MAEKAAPVKYFASIITNRQDLLDDVILQLKDHFGPHDFVSDWYPFTHTNFYEPEMGADLKRIFVSFERPFPPEVLPDSKKWASAVEDKFRVDGKRGVNIDPGYVDYCKLVLATGKFGGHKIAVSKECYADFIMRYSKNAWIAMPWCFPDFKSGIYDNALTEIRNIYKNQCRLLV